MFRNHRLAVAFVSLWMAAAIGLLPASTGAQPPTAQGTTLVKAAVPSLPGPPDPGVEVWFFRLSMDAGRILPSSPNLGVTMLFVESGSFTIEQQGAADIIHADGSRESFPSSATAAAQTSRILTAGETLVTGTGSSTGLQNTSAHTATALVYEVFSPIEEVQTTATPIGELPGVRMQPLSVGRGALPEGAGTITIERVVVKPGEMTAEKGSLAIEIGAVEQGSARITAMAKALVWQWSSGGDARSDSIFGAAPAERALKTGDGYALPNGINGFLRAEGSAPATILRVIIAPASKP